MVLTMKATRIILIICVAMSVLCGAFSGHAQEAADKAAQGPLLPNVMGDFRDLKVTQARARVDDVIDGVTIVTNDGKKVRLSGIWVPWDTPDDPGDNVKKAATLLSKAALGRYVRLYQTRDEKTGRENRIGQTLAQVEREDGLWLQGALLYAGLATVMTTPGNPECAARMYALEADARKRKAGLWADPRWAVLTPEQAHDYVNEYRVIEGKVFSTAMKNNTFFINFGRDWRSDFTVAVPSDKRLGFSRQGVNLMGLNGKTVRVRGWIRNYNGPFIEISHPQQIEVLD